MLSDSLVFVVASAPIAAARRWPSTSNSDERRRGGAAEQEQINRPANDTMVQPRRRPSPSRRQLQPVYKPTKGGGLPRKRPFPPPDPTTLSDSTAHTPHSPRRMQWTAYGDAPLLLPPELSRLQRPSRTTSRRGVVTSFPRRAFNTCPGGRDNKYEREERRALHLQGWNY